MSHTIQPLSLITRLPLFVCQVDDYQSLGNDRTVGETHLSVNASSLSSSPGTSGPIEYTGISDSVVVFCSEMRAGTDYRPFCDTCPGSDV